MELWLREDFAHAWQGRDPFAVAFSLEGETYRVLEQRQTLAFMQGGKRYFIKRHRGATWGEILKNLLSLRLPVVSAHNEFRALRKLHELGLRAPTVVAYGRRGWLPGSLESFLVTEDVGAHETLEDHCREWAVHPPAIAAKRALIDELADISRRMHTHGMCHRDYYLCHFLRTDTSAPLTLIDLHRALVKPRLATRWIVKDIAGLYFSAMDCGLTRRDLYRFMRRYRHCTLRETLVQDRGFWDAVRTRALRLYRKENGGV
ncbi:MAG: lipopolysaccharide core heptose(I) kinase RfaP [Gammaproteobacteria bacterium]